MFTPAECRIAVNGTIIALSSGDATIQTDGQQLHMSITLAGVLPATPLPVEVTLYRGQPVRVASAALTIDAANSFAENARNESTAGTLLLFVGPLVIIFASLPRIAERLGTGPGGIKPR